MRALLAAAARRPARVDEVASLLGIRALMERGIRFLSSGEARRTLFAQALLMEPRLMVLDNPYEGVDRASRQILRALVDELLGGPTHVLLLTRRPHDIAPGINHVPLLERGRACDRGPREAVLAGAAMQRLFGPGARLAAVPLPAPPDDAPAEPCDGPLIELRDVHAHYGENEVLDGVGLRLDPGEHLCIAGPNGCGKSTLLALICGDNPRAYGQHVKQRRVGVGHQAPFRHRQQPAAPVLPAAHPRLRRRGQRLLRHAGTLRHLRPRAGEAGARVARRARVVGARRRALRRALLRRAAHDADRARDGEAPADPDPRRAASSKPSQIRHAAACWNSSSASATRRTRRSST